MYRHNEDPRARRTVKVTIRILLRRGIRSLPRSLTLRMSKVTCAPFSDVPATGTDEERAHKERLDHDDVLVIAESAALRPTRRPRHRLHYRALQPRSRQDARQRRQLQLRVRGVAREPGPGRAGDAVGRTGAPGRGVPGDDAGGDRRTIRRRLASAGHPPRHTIPAQRILQAQLRAGDHQAAERWLPGGSEQRRRHRGPTVLGVPVRTRGRQHLTEYSVSAQSDLQIDPLPAARPRPRVSSTVQENLPSRLHRG